MTILVSPFTSGLSKQLCQLARMGSLSQLKTIKVSVFGLKLGIIFTYIYIQKQDIHINVPYIWLNSWTECTVFFLWTLMGYWVIRGCLRLNKCRIFYYKILFLLIFFLQILNSTKKISFFSMDNARSFSQYIIKQDICIYIPYSWPNGWTERAEIFCGQSQVAWG